MSTTGSTLSKAQNYVRVLSSTGATSLSVSDTTTHTKLDTIDTTLNGTLSVSDGTTQTTLSQINDKTPALGQALKASSVPVTIASNQDTLQVQDTSSQSVLTDIKTAVEGTLAVSDSTAQSTLSTISGKIPALGQATMANSLPVAIASNQGSLTVSDSTAQSSLSAIDTKLGGTLLTSSALTAIRATGDCYFGYSSRDTNAVGSGSLVYLINASGSGKTLYVYGARFSQRGNAGAEARLDLKLRTGSVATTGASAAKSYSNMKITSTTDVLSDVAVFGQNGLTSTRTFTPNAVIVNPNATSVYGELFPAVLELGEDTALEIELTALVGTVECGVTLLWYEI